MVTGIAIITGTIVTMVAGDHGDTGTGLRTMATGVTGMPITVADAVVLGEMTMDVMTVGEITMDGTIMDGMTMATTVLTPGSETITCTVMIHSVPGSLKPVITNHVHQTERPLIPGRRILPAQMVCGKRTITG